METITHLRALFCVQVSLDPLPDNKILDWSKLKQIADDIFMRFKMDNKCHIGWKTIVRKEKLLVTSNFSFTHNVFHCYISLVQQNVA